VKWDGKAEYLLRLEPLGLQQNAGFAAAVGAPLQSVFFDIQLKDASGFLLCSKRILLKINPENSPDIFQPEMGKEDGKVAAINAQGNLSCDAKAYNHLDYWDFSTNFPTLAEQSDLLNYRGHLTERAVQLTSPSHANDSLHTAARRLFVTLEGDDVITGYAPSSGVAQTSAGRIFVIARGGAQGHGAGWQVFPASIHYRCNKYATCIITRNGTTSTNLNSSG
jgi:hypothetical protein